jgi:hypothetical protein
MNSRPLSDLRCAGAPRSAISPAETRHGVCVPGSKVSLRQLLEHVDVQRLLSHELLQPLVLDLEVWPRRPSSRRTEINRKNLPHDAINLMWLLQPKIADRLLAPAGRDPIDRPAAPCTTLDPPQRASRSSGSAGTAGAWTPATQNPVQMLALSAPSGVVFQLTLRAAAGEGAPGLRESSPTLAAPPARSCDRARPCRSAVAVRSSALSL